MATPVDLTKLAHAPPAGPVRLDHRARLTWLTRWVLPGLLIFGFLATVAYSFRESLLRATPVTVVPVMSLRAEVEQSGAELFQSAGWVEARPTPVLVSALEEGVVEELLVIEGQQLKQGDLVARLIDEDARLKLRDAEAELASRQAELASAQASQAAAEIRYREPLELETKLAEAEAMLARVENELARLPSQVRAAQARLEFAGKEKESRLQSGEAVSRLAVARSEQDYESAQAAVTELEVQKRSLEKEIAAQKRRVESLRRQLELKVDEQYQLDEARAAVARSQSMLKQAEVTLDTAELRLSRMEIRAPSDGTVLALVARPGTKVMGLAPASMPDASTVITMYDPARLQIRADVRLEEVPHVFTGQQVKIETPAVPGVLPGEVIAATSLTDIQKNTLQVKVAILDPPPVLKPDMLVQVTFLAPATPQSATGSESPVALAIPTELIHHVDGEPRVWVADREQQTARLQSVKLGSVLASGLREVKSGLAIGDRLIASGVESLEPGERIRIIGEAPPRERAAKPRVKRL